MRLIDADAAIDALKEKVFHNLSDEFYGAMQVLDELPEQQYIPVTEESVIQAGYEGKEVRFRLRGRLFAIRELAQ